MSAATLGAFAFTIAPALAANGDSTAWHEVEVKSNAELELSGSTSEKITLTPSATGTAVSSTAGSLDVKANQAWKLQWQAVQLEYTDVSTTAAAGTFLTASGFGATVANASLAYKGTNAAASNPNEWSAQLAYGGVQTPAFTALTTALTTIQTGTATSDATLTPTYSADIDASLTNGTYYGTIYYKLTAGV